jgi:8-oxo-dGTP pyrophosphatase MutT (NUDIX family)
MVPPETLMRVRARLAAALAPPVSPIVPLMIDGSIAGRVTRSRAQRLARFSNVFYVCDEAIAFVEALDDAPARTRAMAEVAKQLAAEGALTPWREERYAVGPSFGAAPWFELERAAARFFGIHTYAAHVNGLVRTQDGIAMWLARRSPTKAIDPGMLDNLVGGGIASGMSIAATVVKESWEEAGIPAAIAATASTTGEITLVRESADGIQHETVFVHDLWLDRDFVPQNQDGEAVEHRLVPLAEMATILAGDHSDDTMTVDATLVALDCLRRLGVLPRQPLARSPA